MYLLRKYYEGKQQWKNYNPNSNVVFLQCVHKIPSGFQVKAIIKKKKYSPARSYFMSQIQFKDTMS
jgi:hypothetical protein